MNKKKLKKFYIKESLILYGTRLILKAIKHRFIPKGLVLIKCCDGIGDVLVRSKLMKLLENKYGKENIYVLMKSQYVKLGKMLGYKVIPYSRKDRKSFIPHLKKLYELNMMGFSKFIDIEFGNDIVVGGLFIPERKSSVDLGWKECRNNKYYTETFKITSDYIINEIAQMATALLGKNYTTEDLIPSLDVFEKANENIVVAIGSTDRLRVCSPIIMAKYLKEIRKIFSDKKIILVGNGAEQIKYADKIMEILDDDKNIKNFVDKTSLQEVFEIVAKSFLFVGFESGLYNFAFVTHKKCIALFKDSTVSFAHNYSNWIKIITPKKIKPIVYDKKYPDEAINSITVDQFKESLNMIEKNDFL